MNKEILSLDNQISRFKFSQPVQTQTSSAYPEIDGKLTELKMSINRNQEANEKAQNIIDTFQKKIPADEEFLKRFVAEKRVWLDQCDSEKLRDQTYNNGFKYLYEAKVMKMIFEGIFLDKIQEMIDERAEEKLKNFGEGEARQKIIDTITMEVTFEFFKKKCFDAWRFKNILLAADEYVILDYVKKLYVEIQDPNPLKCEEQILGKIMTILDDLKKDAEEIDKNKKSSVLAKVYWPLMNTLMTIIFLSIGNKRVKIHKEKIDTVIFYFIL
jgi:hypothetical protein